MDRVTYTPPTSELPLVGPEEPADAVPDGHQRSPFVELDRQTWARLASEMAQPFDQADVERLRGLCLLYTSPSPRDRQKSRMPSSA